MTSNAPLLWLFDPEDPLIDLGDGFAMGNLLVALEPTSTPAADLDPDYPWAWLTSPYWPPGATRHDNANGLTLPGLFPHVTAAPGPVVSDELDYPFAWVLKKSNIPGNVIHDPYNGLFVRPLFPSVVVTTGGGTGVVQQLFGNSDGTSTVAIQFTVELSSTVIGTSTVSGEKIISGILYAGFEIPYLLGRNGTRIQTLDPLNRSMGSSTVTATLLTIKSFAATSTGSSAVTGTLFTAAGTGFLLASPPTGIATVTGWLQVGMDGFIELAGIINGTSTLSEPTLNAAEQKPRYLYLYVNVGVGFDDYDTYAVPTPTADFASQTFPDGNQNPSLLSQYLYQYLNIGVGFDDYDDISDRPGWVSQTFPDGHNRDDWARFLYHYLNVIKWREAFGKLAILPSDVGRDTFVPHPSPPSNTLT